MKIASLFLTMLVAPFLPASARPVARASTETVQMRCPDELVLAKDLIASRAAHQPDGASQSGSPWIALDALRSQSNAQRRDFMLASIREQLASRHSNFDLSDLDRVLTVMRGIKREAFLPPAERAVAYLPMSLDIGHCQTLSDAYIIALMTSVAHVGPNANVLDVGTGSGYQAAILSRLGKHIQSLEIVPALAAEAGKRLRHLGYRNVDVALADGFAGWPARSPYDVILVTAGSTAIPQPLIDQLKPGGRLIMPIGPTAIEEELILLAKSRLGNVTRCTLGMAAFVPMTGMAQKIARVPASNGPTAPKGLPRCYLAPVT